MSIHNGVRISQNPAILSGRPIIDGHRISVHDIASLYQSGESVEEISDGYLITREQVVAALAYYHAHQEVIDRELTEDVAEISRRAALDRSPQAEAIRQRARELGLRRAR